MLMQPYIAGKNESALEKYDTLNYKVLDMVAEASFPNCKVLDVGCWTGNLGGALKKRLSYQITIDGIENNSNAVKSVKDRGIYNKIFEMDLNNPFLPLNMQYDIIVFSDVLEHLIDPEKTLQEILKNLGPRGWVIMSLPNIAFIKYRLLHFLGNWDYKNSGIMDRTHLHFYTLDTMKALFKACNLEIVEQQSLMAIPKKYFIILLLSKVAPRVFALQFVFKLSLIG